MLYHSGTGRYYPPLSNELLYLVANSNKAPFQRVHLVAMILRLFDYSLTSVNRKLRAIPMPYQETTFVNCKLTEKQKKDFVTWVSEQMPDVDMHLANVILGGHKLSLSYSDKNKSFSCAITCRDKGSVNNNRCVVSMHKSPYDALWVALYKHVMILCDGDWEDVTGDSDWG